MEKKTKNNMWEFIKKLWPIKTKYVVLSHFEGTALGTSNTTVTVKLPEPKFWPVKMAYPKFAFQEEDNFVEFKNKEELSSFLKKMPKDWLESLILSLF